MAQGSQKDRRWLRHIGPILMFGAFPCAGLLAQAQGDVPGMSRFTDRGFGFSFWYPTAWKVKEEPVDPRVKQGWFADAKLIKELDVFDPEMEGKDGADGVIIQELLASAGLAELGHTMSASPVGIDQRYLFDGRTHRWIYVQLSEAPDGTPPQAHPVDIKKMWKTMGGLPIFVRAQRGGADVIVPLDASHFLAISTMQVGGDYDHNYLATTVVSTGQGAGKPASEQVQAETVYKAAIKLGAIGQMLGYWYKDSEHVYDQNGELLRGANPKTFALLDGANPSFATDGVSVYFTGGVIPGADPMTFVPMGQFTAKDAHHTYETGYGLKIDGLPAEK
jgi:hypothetical protein